MKAKNIGLTVLNCRFSSYDLYAISMEVTVIG